MKIFIVILVTVAVYAYSQYGYLVGSIRNLPPRDRLESSGPLSYTKVQSDESLSFLKVPAGFAVTYFAQDVPGARSLTSGDNGVIYVGTRPQGAVYALEDIDKDGRADTRYVVASDLDDPNGVTYSKGSLYVAEIGRIIVFKDIDKTYKDNPKFDVVYDQLPKETHHGWRYMRSGPDGKLYVGIGAPCNVCERKDPFASIARLNTDGTGFEVVARGIRNTVGFDWNPVDNSLWFTDNGRDQMGDDVPGDELNRVGDTSHFGFPYCHQGSISDPLFGKGKDCKEFAAPAINLGPHVAALGMRFYRGTMFPDEYTSKAIIAEHGSWNRSDPIGYRLMTVDVHGEKSSLYKEFITGWLDDSGKAVGRPVDVLEQPDGSVLVSDDLKGAVYRISYSAP